MPVYKSNEKTKDGRQYFFKITYKDIFGNNKTYKSKKYKTLKEATNEETFFKMSLLNQTINADKITIKDIFKDYMYKKQDQVKQTTLRKDKTIYLHIKPIENININDIDLNKYRQWNEYIKNEDISLITKNKVLQLFKRLIIYSSKYFGTSDSIVKYVDNFKDVNKFKKEMDFYTLDEYKKFSSVIDDREYKLFFDMLYYLGLRQGEACALTFEDIDFNNKTIRINKTLTTKLKGVQYSVTPPKTKQSNRLLPLTNLLIDELKEQINIAKQYNNYKKTWFIFGNELPFRESTIYEHKKKYCKLAELREIRIHDFRHSCASLLINQGGSITLVSKYLGHSNIKITLETYTHLYKSELTNMTDILNKIS